MPNARQKPKPDRTIYQRIRRARHGRRRPDPAYVDEGVIFFCQLDRDSDASDQDEYISLRWAVLRRALFDLENAHDVRQNVRWPGEENCDYDGTIEEIEEWFFDDEFSVFHPCDAPHAEAPAQDEALISISPVTGLWTIEKADGIFSFAGLCEALNIPIDTARTQLRAWINRRMAGSTERLISDGRRNISPRANRPARRPDTRTIDQLLDDNEQSRAERIQEIVTRRANGESVEAIAAAFECGEGHIRTILRQHRDQLGPLAPKLRRGGVRFAARNAEIRRLRALGVKPRELSVRFGLSHGHLSANYQRPRPRHRERPDGQRLPDRMETTARCVNTCRRCVKPLGQ